MSKGTTSYRIKDENALYFLTCATVEWINVFTKRKYKEVFVDSVNHCVQQKGLVVYGWVLMSNHFHLIAMAKEGSKLSAIMRDLKKHVAKEVVRMIQEEPEGRREWLLKEMKKAGSENSKKQIFQLWRNDNHPIHLFKPETIQQKLNYIHNNPVEEGLVSYPQEYLYGSAKDYSDEKGPVQIELING